MAHLVFFRFALDSGDDRPELWAGGLSLGNGDWSTDLILYKKEKGFSFALCQQGSFRCHLLEGRGDTADSDPLIRVFVLARIVCFKITQCACKDLESGFPQGLWGKSRCLTAMCGRSGANAGIHSISCTICLKSRGVCNIRLLSCVSERQDRHKAAIPQNRGGSH